MSTITLNDPQTGESVELQVPEDCPYFRYHDGGNPLPEVTGWWFDLSQMNGSTIRDMEGDSSDGPFLTLAGEWLPIIAAVAKEWFEVLAKEAIQRHIQAAVEHNDIELEKTHHEKVRLITIAKNWGRFTCKPTPAPQERRAMTKCGWIKPDEIAIQANKDVEPEGERIRQELIEFLERNKICGMLLDTPNHHVEIDYCPRLPNEIKPVLQVWGSVYVVVKL